MQLNYMGSLHAAKAVYEGMVSRNSGHICFIASTMALMGEGGRDRASTQGQLNARTITDTTTLAQR